MWERKPEFWRVPAFLVFDDGNTEILVRSIRALRRVFHRSFYPQLVACLRSGMLERFFLALGMYEVREIIQTLKESGRSELEIINKVAELIGAEPIFLEFPESPDFPGQKDLLEEINNTDQEIILTGKSYLLEVPELELKGSKIFRKEGSGTTELVLSVSHIKGTGKLLFENLCVVIDNSLVLEGFKKVELRNVELRAKSKMSSLELVNTELELHGCDIRIALELKKVRLKAEGSSFCDPSMGGIVSEKSHILLKDCKIAGNAGHILYEAQVWLDNSMAEFLSCEIVNGDAAGILSNRSKVFLVNCRIYGHKSEGIYAKGGSHVYLDNCEICENGGQHDVQIYVEDSTVNIENSRIYNSETAGILACRSEASIIGCEIYNNKQHAILTEEKTELKVEKCNIYRNGISNYAQIYLEETQATIKDSQIHDPIEENVSGIFMKKSKAHVQGCDIYKNNAGISSTYMTTVHVENCDLHENNAALYVLNSKASVIGCRIYKNENFGIYAEKSRRSKVIIQNCDIYESGEYGYTQIYAEKSRIFVESSQIHDGKGHGLVAVNSNVSLVGCKIYRNKQNGIIADEKTKLDMHDCDVYEGIPLEDPPINIDEHLASSEDMEEREVADGIGIYIANSEASLIRCNIYRNELGGLLACKQSSVRLERCDIYENCFHVRSQISISENSNAVIKDSLIHDSREGTGLIAMDSKVSLIGCKIYQNGEHGIWVLENTKLNIEDSIIHRNGGSSYDYPQVYIENSLGVIENSGVYESLSNSSGICLEGGALLLHKVETQGNVYGVYVYDGSVAMHDCNIQDGIFN